MCEFQNTKRTREKSLIQRSKNDLNISHLTPPSKKLQFKKNENDLKTIASVINVFIIKDCKRL